MDHLAELKRLSELVNVTSCKLYNDGCKDHLVSEFLQCARTQVEQAVSRLEKSSFKKNNSCPKCQGSGVITNFSHVNNGVCFSCNGTGKSS
jgi:DnaJ-class molecular chaperone